MVTLEVPQEQVKNYGIVVADKERPYQSFRRSPPRRGQSISPVLASIFEPEVLDLVPSGKTFDIGSELFPMLVEKGAALLCPSLLQLDRHRASERLLDGADARAERRCGPDGHAGQGPPGRRVGGADTSIAWDGVQIVGPVYIGSSVTIEPGASIIRPTWISHGSHQVGCQVGRSICLVPACRKDASPR